MPEGAIYVGRPSRWGNPFEVGRFFTSQLAVDAFIVHIASYFGWADRTIRRAFHPLPVESAEFREWLAPLVGHDLACWCSLCEAHADGRPLGVECPLDMPCHADVLLELANR